MKCCTSASCVVESLESRRLLSAGPEVLLDPTAVPEAYYGNAVHRQQISADAQGNLLMVRQNADGTTIYARWFNADLQALSDAFVIATRTSAGESTALPEVDVAPDGTAVVAWAENFANSFSIYAKVLQGPTDLSGRQITVGGGKGRYVSATSAAPAIAADGTFAVAWEKVDNGLSDSVHVQRMDASGRKLGKLIDVSVGSEGGHRPPAIDMDASGNFVVVFPLGGLDNWNLWARRYSNSGTALGDKFRINDPPATRQEQNGASVSIAPAGGRFVVGWAGFGIGVYMRVFDASGASVVPHAQVLLDASGTSPSVSMASDGATSGVTWVSQQMGEITTITDGTRTGQQRLIDTLVQAGTFAADGSEVSAVETIAQATRRVWRYDDESTSHLEGASIVATQLALRPLSVSGQQTFFVAYQRDDDASTTGGSLEYAKVWTADNVVVAANTSIAETTFSSQTLIPSTDVFQDEASVLA